MAGGGPASCCDAPWRWPDPVAIRALEDLGARSSWRAKNRWHPLPREVQKNAVRADIPVYIGSSGGTLQGKLQEFEARRAIWIQGVSASTGWAAGRGGRLLASVEGTSGARFGRADEAWAPLETHFSHSFFGSRVPGGSPRGKGVHRLG